MKQNMVNLQHISSPPLSGLFLCTEECDELATTKFYLGFKTKKLSAFSIVSCSRTCTTKINEANVNLISSHSGVNCLKAIYVIKHNCSACNIARIV